MDWFYCKECGYEFCNIISRCGNCGAEIAKCPNCGAVILTGECSGYCEKHDKWVQYDDYCEDFELVQRNAPIE